MSESKSRVFVLEMGDVRHLSQDAHANIQKAWERTIEGSELDGSRLLVLTENQRLMELTGEGLPKVEIDAEGNIKWPSQVES